MNVDSIDNNNNRHNNHDNPSEGHDVAANVAANAVAHRESSAPATVRRRRGRERVIVRGALGAACVGLLLPMAACSRGGDSKAGEAKPDIAGLASSAEVDCAFDGAAQMATTPTCYEISVPEDWAHPDDNDRVVLTAAVFHAGDPDAKPSDSLIFLQGGPGGTALDSITEAAMIDPFVAQRDVIVFDQRGVGKSTPSLDCDAEAAQMIAAGSPDLSNEASQQADLDAYQACHDRLAAEGVNFEAYNSIASSHDIEAIRSELGYDQLDLWGVSYGTRLAQTFMRLYPKSVRSVVIDSVVPVDANIYEYVPISSKQSIERLFAACAADSACAEAYPDLENDFFALSNQLNAEPVSIDVEDLDGNVYTVDFDGHDLLYLTFNLMYSKQLFQDVPQMIADAKAGDFASTEAFATMALQNDLSISGGMYFAVECNEEVPFESRDGLAANVPDDDRFGKVDVFADTEVFGVCEMWNAGRAPDVENEPVTSDIPTLLLTGHLDPITPPEFAQQVAAHLSKSYLFEFPNEGHGVSMTSCGLELISAFLADPATEPDGSCTDQEPAPRWVPQSTEVELVPGQIERLGSAGDVTINIVLPRGWEVLEPGFYLRHSTAADETIILVGVVEGRSIDQLVDGSPIDNLHATGASTVDGEQWETYEGEIQGSPVRILVSPSSELFVLISGSSDELDELTQTVAIPVAASMEIA